MGNKKIQHYIRLYPVLIVCLLVSLSQIFADRFSLAYDRNAILQGEWWRLLTGGWLHHNLNHLLMNLAAWVAIWLLLPQRLQGITGIGLFSLLILLVDILIFLLLPGTHYYWGLSGALHGLFALAAIELVSERDQQGWWWLLGLAGKLAWDLCRSDSVTAELIGTRVHTESHLLGTLCGILAGILIRYCRRANKPA